MATFVVGLVFILMGFFGGAGIGRRILKAASVWLVGLLILVIAGLSSAVQASSHTEVAKNLGTGLILGVLSEAIYHKPSRTNRQGEDGIPRC